MGFTCIVYGCMGVIVSLRCGCVGVIVCFFTDAFLSRYRESVSQ